jgi:hypothetical protein
MRLVSRAALVCAAIAVLAPATASAVQPEGVPVQRPDLRPGDVVRMDGIGAVVPGRGTGVTGETYGPTGSKSVRVETDRSGNVSVTRGEPVSTAGSGGAAGLAPCSDGAYNLNGTKWYTTFGWYFNAGTTPSEITQDNALHDIQHATENMKWVNNDCGVADNAGATSSYLGETTTSTQVNSDLTCGANDDKSVVGFGTIDGSNVLAVACTWSVAHTGYDEIVASDVKYDKGTFTWFTGSVPSGCSNRWSVEGVGTHERGHSFGLGHVSESSHPNLTMSEAINGPCQRSETTLGLGDANAMNTLY